MKHCTIFMQILSHIWGSR